MKRLFSMAMIGPVALLGLTVGGCDSQAKKEVKEQAEAIDQSAKADADLMEARALGSPEANAVHNEAEALRNEGEQTKDHLKNIAGELK